MATFVRLASEHGMAYRKQMLILSRYQGIPDDPFSNMYDMVQSAVALTSDALSLENARTQQYPNLTGEEILSDILEDPVDAGTIITIMSQSPYTKNEEDTIRYSLLLKERNAIDAREAPPRIDFSPWTGYYGRRMHPDINLDEQLVCQLSLSCSGPSEQRPYI